MNNCAVRQYDPSYHIDDIIVIDIYK